MPHFTDSSYIPKRAVILAAGRGTRLRPYTDLTPKPLLEIDGRPMLETVLIAAKAAGVAEVCIVVHHLAEQIKAFVGNGRKWDLSVSYVYQERLAGTADAVHCAADFITSPCFILAADYALPRHFLTDLKEAYLAQSCPLFASLKALDTAELSRKSSVRFSQDGRITEIVEKPPPGQAPSNISAGLFLIVPPEIRSYLQNPTLSSRGEYEIMDILNHMILDGHPMSGLLQPQPPEWTIER